MKVNFGYLQKQYNTMRKEKHKIGDKVIVKSFEHLRDNNGKFIGKQPTRYHNQIATVVETYQPKAFDVVTKQLWFNPMCGYKVELSDGSILYEKENNLHKKRTPQ